MLEVLFRGKGNIKEDIKGTGDIKGGIKGAINEGMKGHNESFSNKVKHKYNLCRYTLLGCVTAKRYLLIQFLVNLSEEN